jgi:hypothetical protein
MQPHPLEGILDCQRIDDGGKHSHVISGDPVHTSFGQTGPPENVATPDDDGNLNASLNELADFVRNPGQDGSVNSVIAIAHQGFAAKLDEHAAIARRNSRGRHDT